MSSVFVKPIKLGFYYDRNMAIKKARKAASKHRAKIKRIKKANENLIAFRATSLLNAAYARAKKKDIPFSLTQEWLEEKLRQGRCEATGLTFVFTLYGGNTSEEGKYTTNPNAPSLDQIRPSQGYTPDNVQVVISAFNKFKSDTEQHRLYKISKAFCKQHMKRRRFRVDH